MTCVATMTHGVTVKGRHARAVWVATSGDVQNHVVRRLPAPHHRLRQLHPTQLHHSDHILPPLHLFGQWHLAPFNRFEPQPLCLTEPCVADPARRRRQVKGWHPLKPPSTASRNSRRQNLLVSYVCRILVRTPGVCIFAMPRLTRRVPHCLDSPLPYPSTSSNTQRP